MIVKDLEAQKLLPPEQRMASEHMGLKNVLVEDGPYGLLFWCPGCDMAHRIEHGLNRWAWCQNKLRPTINPSINVTWTEGDPPVDKRCHSYVTDGMIQFLSDCTHKLAGQTVVLGPFDWGRE